MKKKKQRLVAVMIEVVFHYNGLDQAVDKRQMLAIVPRTSADISVNPRPFVGQEVAVSTY